MTPVVGAWPQGVPTSLLDALGEWAARSAQLAITAVLNDLGPSSEPDYASIVPVYDRMLAIALLLSGAMIACALLDDLLGGRGSSAIAVVPRALLATLVSYCGLALVIYAGRVTGLLGESWNSDLQSMGEGLGQLAGGTSPANVELLPVGSVLGLILTAILTTLMALLIYVELAARAALLLLSCVFIPFISALWIWPRLASGAPRLAGFIFGLLLSKFVIATAVLIGIRLVLEGAVGARTQSWMVTGLAVLTIAALSPALLVGGIRFSEPAAASAARGFASWALPARLLRSAPRLVGSLLRRPRRPQGGERPRG
ncbi:MAG: hypothetical protein ACRENM_00695 [Candidatus Dormibacteraceae bacterium]